MTVRIAAFSSRAAQAEPVPGLESLLDVFCPMHVVLSPSGHVSHAGPALARVFRMARLDGAEERNRLEGTHIFDLLEPLRPHGAPEMSALLALTGARLSFALRDPPHTELKGVIVPLPVASPERNSPKSAQVAGGAVLNLSFGISIVDAVRDFALTGTDFAVTDLAVEMLYLVEAQTTVMGELRRLNSRLEGARLAAEARATTDPLTGLGNRRALAASVTEAERGGAGATLMHLDLDLFKEVNDTFGHAAGDHVLQVVSQRLTATLRARDSVIRLGGDEFLLLLPGMTDTARVEETARRIIDTLERPISFGSERLHISASIGSTVSPPNRAMDAVMLMQESDTALYTAKDAGRRTHFCYTPSLGQIGPEAAQTPEIGSAQ